MLDPWETVRLSLQGKEQKKKHSKIPLVLSTHTIFKTHIKTKCRQSLNFRQSQWAIAACMLESPPLLIWSATHEGQCHCQVPQSTCAQEREKGASTGLLTLFLLLGNTCRTTKTWMVWAVKCHVRTEAVLALAKPQRWLGFIRLLLENLSDYNDN